MYTKTELAVKFGVPVAEVEYYSYIGILRPQTTTSHEMYSEADCVRLEVVLKGKRLGFSDFEIRQLIDGAQKSDKALLDGKLKN